MCVAVSLIGALPPPLYSRKGWQGFYMCKVVNYLLVSVVVVVQVWWRSATPSLGYGLTAWSLL